MVDLIVDHDVCMGGVIDRDHEKVNVYAKKVVLATGGIGGLYQHSTN